jgi:2-hydroxycyclohexanecarboxyl-CoA dehydrogenase
LSAHFVVTGAAGAIGSAISRGLRARYPDARLTLVDVDKGGAGALAATLGQADAAAWDLARPDTLPAELSATVDRRGPVDVLVNCAGVMEMRSLVATPWTVGARLLDIDLVSPLRLMSLVAPSMVARRAGTIVNVSSMAGVTPLRGCTFYGGAKAGLAMASEVARLELLPHGVQVITVYPGPVRSGLERRARAQVPEGILTRVLPTGDPEALGARVLQAMARGEARVVYPSLYELANRIPRVAGWITSNWSPVPRD